MVRLQGQDYDRHDYYHGGNHHHSAPHYVSVCVHDVPAPPGRFWGCWDDTTTATDAPSSGGMTFTPLPTTTPDIPTETATGDEPRQTCCAAGMVRAVSRVGSGPTEEQGEEL